MTSVLAFLLLVIACLINLSHQQTADPECPAPNAPDGRLAGSGAITSMNYPALNDFGPDASCKWQINVTDSSTIVRLVVEDACLYPDDTLAIYDTENLAIIGLIGNCSGDVQYFWSVGYGIDVVLTTGATGIARFKLSFSADSKMCPATASSPATPRCIAVQLEVTCACCNGFDQTAGSLAAPCTDVDECHVNNGGCSTNADCFNTVGSRTCKCKTGFKGNGFTCSKGMNCWKIVKRLIPYKGGAMIYRSCVKKLCKYNTMFRIHHPRKC